MGDSTIRRAKKYCASLGMLQVLDVITTMIALRMGAEECNPLALNLFISWGELGLVTGLIVKLLWVYAVYKWAKWSLSVGEEHTGYMRKLIKDIVVGLLVLMVGWWLYIVVNNLAVIVILSWW